MIVSRNQLKELRSRRDSQGKYESRPTTGQNTIWQQEPQTAQSMSSFSIKRAMSEVNSNSLIKRNKATSSSHKLQPIFSQESSLKHSAQMRKKYSTMSFDIDLTNRNLRQFIIAMPTSINVRQIYSLNLAQNHIKQILPTLLVPFQSLKQLNLSNNKLQKISFPYNKMKLRQLSIEKNSLANLNLQHLKYLESVNASKNKLIFITLPESLKLLNLDHNLLSNMYFIQKCQKLQLLSMNFNFIYDFTFNSINQLDCMMTKKQAQCPRFYKLSRIECSHNKITHLNGLFNIKYVQQLMLQFNQLNMNRQNLNELFYLEHLKELNLVENPLQGTYGLNTTLEFIIKKLSNLQLLNGHPKQLYESQFKRTLNIDSSQAERNQDAGSINDQSSIKEHSQIMQNSAQKPFRLFLDQDFSPQNFKSTNLKISPRHQNNPKKHKQTKEWIYTLGDSQSKIDPQSNDSQIFKLMTLCNDQATTTNHQQLNLIKKPQTPKQSLHKSNQKLHLLQEQVLNKIQPIEISLSSIEFVHNQFQLDYQSRNILKIIFQMSFIPPLPIKHSSKTQTFSKRLDQDTDQYLLFSQLFQKRKGILYLKKIFLLEQNSPIFVSEDYSSSYELSFFNHPEVYQYYTQMSQTNTLLTQVFREKDKANPMEISHYLSPVPNSFGCHHILVINLKGKPKAFEKRHFTPVCYLIESKNI